MTEKSTYCDICYRDITNRDVKYKFKKYESSYVNYNDFEFKKWSKLDMCPECYEKFLEFIRRQKKEKNTF